MLFQCRASVEDCGSTLQQHWVNATCLLMCRPSVGLGLGQRRRRLTGNEPAICCDAGPTLNRNLVGRLRGLVKLNKIREKLGLVRQHPPTRLSNFLKKILTIGNIKTTQKTKKNTQFPKKI